MPKKIKHIFEYSLTYENLYNSYISCKKGKTYRDDVICYSLNFECHLKNILSGLKNSTYEFSKYREFYVLEPKKRRILAAPFKDRIVHTWFVTYILAPIFEKQYISTSYACIKKRGMLKATLDVQKGMRRYMKEYASYYILKFDISKYFDNIQKNILIDIIKKKVSDKKVLWLLELVLNSSNEYYENSNVGIPIGNLTSQTFANIYLNELDRYIKEKIRCKGYYRYMDDGILLCKNKEDARKYLKNIALFLQENLKLSLNKKTNIFKNSQGVNFCGYLITEKRLRIRQKGKKKLKKKLKLVNTLIFKRKISVEEAKRLLNGHVGYICHACVENLVNRLFIT